MKCTVCGTGSENCGYCEAVSRKVQPLVRLEIDVEIPMDHNPTEDDVREWIEYWTGNRKYIARENPLCYLGIKGRILKYEPNRAID